MHNFRWQDEVMVYAAFFVGLVLLPLALPICAAVGLWRSLRTRNRRGRRS